MHQVHKGLSFCEQLCKATCYCNFFGIWCWIAFLGSGVNEIRTWLVVLLSLCLLLSLSLCYSNYIWSKRGKKNDNFWYQKLNDNYLLLLARVSWNRLARFLRHQSPYYITMTRLLTTTKSLDLRTYCTQIYKQTDWLASYCLGYLDLCRFRLCRYATSCGSSLPESSSSSSATALALPWPWPSSSL